jgi:ABC-type molybdate transport system substrate-binding protein
MRRSVAMLGCAALLLAACGSDGGGDAPIEVTVFAASSLTDAFTQIGSDF